MNTRENVLQRLSNGLRREALAYRIVGIVSLVTSILLILIAIVTLCAGAFMTATETPADDIYYSENYIVENDDTSIEHSNNGLYIEDGDSSVEFNGDGLYIEDGDSSVEFNDDGLFIEDGDSYVEFGQDGLIIEDGEDVYTFTEDDAFIFAGVGVMAVGGFYFGFGCSLLAIAIVNLVMASKVSKSRYSEVLTAKHAGSVGSIVLAALFNEIALIFVIINFVLAKKHRAVLEN